MRFCTKLAYDDCLDDWFEFEFGLIGVIYFYFRVTSMIATLQVHRHRHDWWLWLLYMWSKPDFIRHDSGIWVDLNWFDLCCAWERKSLANTQETWYNMIETTTVNNITNNSNNKNSKNKKNYVSPPTVSLYLSCLSVSIPLFSVSLY